MKFENTRVYNFDEAIYGMRLPLMSHFKSDSKTVEDCGEECFGVGDNDRKLMRSLVWAGTEHRKFLRQIMVSVRITAPQYFWLQFDTYKVGTTSNSSSKMHCITKKPITLDDFEGGDLQECDFEKSNILGLIETLEKLRVKYLETKNPVYWKELIRWLPESYKQTRLVTLNYEVIRNMYVQRKNHKLSEWTVDFVNWVKSLPLAEDLLIA